MSFFFRDPQVRFVTKDFMGAVTAAGHIETGVETPHSGAVLGDIQVPAGVSADRGVLIGIEDEERHSTLGAMRRRALTGPYESQASKINVPRLIGSGSVLLLLIAAGMLAAKANLPDWSKLLMHFAEVLFGVLLGAFGAEAASRRQSPPV